MFVIAKQGPSERYILIEKEDDTYGSIMDLGMLYVYRARPIGSIAARGYWDFFEKPRDASSLLKAPLRYDVGAVGGPPLPPRPRSPFRRRGDDRGGGSR